MRSISVFFCYDAAEEITVMHFLDQLRTDPALQCRLIECNLYKIFLALCDDLDITDAIPEMEESEGSDFLLEQLHSAIGESEFIEKMQYAPHMRDDVLFSLAWVMCSPLCEFILCWKLYSRIFLISPFW